MTPSTQHALASYIDHGGRVVYLDADPAEAMERANRGGGRPMLNGNANSRWKNCSSSVTQYSARSPTFMSIPGAYASGRSEESD